MLSYAGRIQLIALVLASMQVYWASIFVVPKAVVKYINKVFKGLLWNSGEILRGKAKVSWKQICKPECEGGLGLKDLEKWNEVLMSKHLWNIACNKKSVWVKWIQTNKLKGQSIWKVTNDPNSSCGWKQILSLREKMVKHVYYKVGNGKSIFSWHDR